MQTFYEHENSLMSRNTGAIALRPTGDTNKSHYFLNINSGRRITHNYWTILPMRTEVIITIQQLAVECKKYKGIVFTNKDHNIYQSHEQNR